jgi:quercetin dioxygenase-like cupin family protein
VAALTNIAGALGVEVSALLAEDREQRRVFTAAARAAAGCREAAGKGYRFFPFATERASKSMQPFLFAARRGEVVRKPLSHAGEEFIYMLSGEMRYFVGGEEFRLGPGDSLYYDAAEDHDLEPVSKEVEYLAVFGPAGEEAAAPKASSPRRKT